MAGEKARTRPVGVRVGLRWLRWDRDLTKGFVDACPPEFSSLHSEKSSEGKIGHPSANGCGL